MACYKNLMTKHHDALVKSRQFKIGDLVLKMVPLATKDPTHGKLSRKDHTESSITRDEGRTI